MTITTSRLALAGLAVALSAPLGAAAEATPETVPLSVRKQAESNSRFFASGLRRAIERTAPSIVSVTAVHRTAPADPIGGMIPGVRTGSGLIVGDGGLVVTARWLVDGADDVWIKLPNHHTVQGHVLHDDAQSGLVLLRASAGGLPVAPMVADATPRLGDWVIAIGRSPERITSSGGTIRDLHRSVEAADAAGASPTQRLQRIESSAAAIPVAVGGALVDAHGLVIGVVVADSDTRTRPRNTAVPIDEALELVERVRPSTEHGGR